jgi:GGDEF domain-containing protein
VFNRETDILAGYGGEKFAVISLGNGLAECEVLAPRILQSGRYKKVEHGKEKGQLYLSSSIGLVNLLVNKDTKTNQYLMGLIKRSMFKKSK